MTDKHPDVELAGDRMRLTMDADGTATIHFDDKGTGRVCGGCTACCKLLPLPPLDKPAGQKCRHAKHGKGCTIYATRPYECRTWGCLWLVDPTMAGMPRPDRCHYVIDLLTDYVMVGQDGREPVRLSVIQVWVDPAFPNAHRAPELRRYLAAQSEKWKCGAIVRFNSRDALILFPPAISRDGQWFESRSLGVESRTLDEHVNLANWSVHFEGERQP